MLGEAEAKILFLRHQFKIREDKISEKEMRERFEKCKNEIQVENVARSILSKYL